MHKREFHFVARARVGLDKDDYSFFSLFGPAVRSQKILAVPAVVKTLAGRHSGGQKGREPAGNPQQFFRTAAGHQIGRRVG